MVHLTDGTWQEKLPTAPVLPVGLAAMVLLSG
jgi:hypothetical protein